MKRVKKIASIGLVAAMIFTTATTAFAAPTHIIVGDKAYSVTDALNPQYRQKLQDAAKANADKVYIVDVTDAKETVVKQSEIKAGKDYKASVDKATNRASELEGIKLVDKDGKETDFEVPGKEEVDRTKLANAKAEVAKLDPTAYTKESWLALEAAMAMDEITQKQVDAKVVAINKAVKDLVKKPDVPELDKKALQAAIDNANTKNKADYTDESWAVLQAALDLPETTQGQIDDKVEAINEAIEGLVVNEDEGIFKLEVNFNELSNGTIANVIIEQEYINRIEKVIIEGMEAKQNPNKPELWRVVFDGNKEITKDDVTVVFKEEKPVEIINKEETFAKNGIFGDTAVKVTIKDDFDIESVKVNNMNLPKLNDNTYYNRAFDYLEIGTELIVVVTTTDGTKDQLVLTVVK